MNTTYIKWVGFRPKLLDTIEVLLMCIGCEELNRTTKTMYCIYCKKDKKEKDVSILMLDNPKVKTCPCGTTFSGTISKHCNHCRFLKGKLKFYKYDKKAKARI